MAELQSMTFKSGNELTQFVKERKIQQEHIQEITCTEIMAGYQNFKTYTLFWWRK